MERKGFGIRLGALIIDAIFVAIVYWIISMFFLRSAATGVANATNADEAIAAASAMVRRMLLVQGIVALAYFSTEIFMAASPAKMILGMKIMNADGTPASQGALATRWAIKNVAYFCYVLAGITSLALFTYIGGLGGLVIFIGCFFALGAAKQALHDQIAKTAVYGKAAIVQGFPVQQQTTAVGPPPQV